MWSKLYNVTPALQNTSGWLLLSYVGRISDPFNDTHRENRFTQFSTRIYWNKSFAASDFFLSLQDQLISIQSIVAD